MLRNNNIPGSSSKLPRLNMTSASTSGNKDNITSKISYCMFMNNLFLSLFEARNVQSPQLTQRSSVARFTSRSARNPAAATQSGRGATRSVRPPQSIANGRSRTDGGRGLGTSHQYFRPGLQRQAPERGQSVQPTQRLSEGEEG